MREFAVSLVDHEDLALGQRDDIYNTLSIALADDPRHERALFHSAVLADQIATGEYRAAK